jgi:hypothetical protein
MLISFTILNGLQGDTLQNKMQLINAKLHAFGIQVKSRYFKGAFLQAPVEDGKAALFINQHFQVGAGLVDEDEGIALCDLAAQLIEDDTTQQVKAFAHIGLFAVKVIGPVIAQHDQAAHDSSSLR